MNFSEVYKGRQVFVTGHTGFKGGWLSSWLLQAGAQASGFSLAPATQPNLFEALDLSNRMDSTIGDVRDFTHLTDTLARISPSVVFHLAAQPLVRRSYADPLETFSTNIIGTANLLEAVRKVPSVKAVVIITTDKVYADKGWPWPYRENDALGGLDPYSASKASAELITKVYSSNILASAASPGIATARGGNVIGGGDWSEDRLIPDIIRSTRNSEPLVLRNPAAIRPWQHVLELCEGYMELAGRLLSGAPEFRDCWNFGPNGSSMIDVESVCRLFFKALGGDLGNMRIEPSGLKETKVLRLDISKSLDKLHWRPRLSITETLEWTANWYRDFANDAGCARQTCMGQIKAFQELRATSADASSR